MKGVELYAKVRYAVRIEGSAGHSGDLFWGVDPPSRHASRSRRPVPPKETVPTPGSAYGRATPNLRPTPASSILIDARIHPVLRRAVGFFRRQFGHRHHVDLHVRRDPRPLGMMMTTPGPSSVVPPIAGTRGGGAGGRYIQ